MSVCLSFCWISCGSEWDTKNHYFLKRVSWDFRETPKIITSSRGSVGAPGPVRWSPKKWFSECCLTSFNLLFLRNPQNLNINPQYELSAGGAKRYVENTPKGTRLYCILAQRSRPLALPAIGRLWLVSFPNPLALESSILPSQGARTYSCLTFWVKRRTCLGSGLVMVMIMMVLTIIMIAVIIVKSTIVVVISMNIYFEHWKDKIKFSLKFVYRCQVYFEVCENDFNSNHVWLQPRGAARTDRISQ